MERIYFIVMIIDPEHFCQEVEELHAYEGMTIFEALMFVCEDNGVDYECVGPLVNRSIKEKIKVEAINKNLLKSDTHSLFDCC